MNYDPMSSDLDAAIFWLDEVSLTDSTVSNAWNILKKYYEQCIDSLKNNDGSSLSFSSDSQRNNMYANAARFILNNSFLNDCCNFFDCQEDRIKEAVNSVKSNNRDFDLMIIKICRLYNMRLKLGHSARITYIAKSEFFMRNKVQNIFVDFLSDFNIIANTFFIKGIINP